MIRAFALAATIVLSIPQDARACGAFFGHDVMVAPDQKIVVVYRGGTETYIFRPNFCGSAKDFGVILPIPATLTVNPSLADNALFDDLDKYTLPQQEQVCRSAGGCGGSRLAGADDNGTRFTVPDTGVDVVQKGRVGQFDYVLLQATTVKAFTDWLDTNGFAHGDSDAYQYYVDKHWYFVAFKVTADTSDPPAGKKVCGDLGPIQISFAAAAPVVPSRIASVNTANGSYPYPTWRIFLLGAGQQKLAGGSNYTETLYFANTINQTGLTKLPTLAALAQDGERLTAINVGFPGGGSSEDIVFADAPSSDFRSTQKIFVDCIGGCNTGSSRSTDILVIGAALGLLLALRRARVRVQPNR